MNASKQSKSDLLYTRLRQSKRALLHHVVVFEGEKLLMLDLSVNGFRMKGLSSKNQIKPDQSLEVLWSVLPSMEPVSLKGTCIWRKGDEAGVMLYRVPERIKYLIRALVRQHRNEAL